MESILEKLTQINDILNCAENDFSYAINDYIVQIEKCVENIEKKISMIKLDENKCNKFIQENNRHIYAMKNLIVPYFHLIEMAKHGVV